ncbi:unnamed protein product [Brassica rapa subsp. trilocularis]
MEKANQMKGLCFTPAESAVKVTGVPRLMNSIASLGATFCAFHKGQQATEMRMWRQIQMRNWLMRKKKRPRILCLNPEGFSLTSVLRFRLTSCVSIAASCAMHSAA